METGTGLALSRDGGVPASGSQRARCGACTSPGAATSSTWRATSGGAGATCSGARRRRAAAAGEIRLAPGESYTTPVSTSPGPAKGSTDSPNASTPCCGTGPTIRAVRARSSSTAGRRCTSTTTWTGCCDWRTKAAEVGAERFVLDDGWFRGRRSDNAGLGDWTVDPVVWSEGLTPLVDHVRSRHGVRPLGRAGNGESRLRSGREHPDWVLGPSCERAPPHEPVRPGPGQPPGVDYLLDA